MLGELHSFPGEDPHLLLWVVGRIHFLVVGATRRLFSGWLWLRIISRFQRSLHSLALGPLLYLQSQQCWVESPLPWNLFSFFYLIFSFIRAGKVSTFLKDSCDQTEPSQITWDNLSISRSILFSVIICITFLLPCKVTQSQVLGHQGMDIPGRPYSFYHCWHHLKVYKEIE